MAKTEMVRARIEPELKHSAEAVMHTLGLSVTDAVTLFYKQISLQHGLPFDVRIPNQTTLDAMEQARMRQNLTEYKGLDELKQKMND